MMVVSCHSGPLNLTQINSLKLQVSCGVQTTVICLESPLVKQNNKSNKKKSPKEKKLIYLSLMYIVGSFSFYSQLDVGYVCVFSLKNPSYPEFICKASSGVISFDIHPNHPHMIVVGLYNGNVAVYNLHMDTSSPCYSSSAACGKHQDLVWQVRLKNFLFQFDPLYLNY